MDKQYFGAPVSLAAGAVVLSLALGACSSDPVETVEGSTQELVTTTTEETTTTIAEETTTTRP